MEQKRNQNYLQNGQSHRETSDRPDRPDSQNRDPHEIIINTTGRMSLYRHRNCLSRTQSLEKPARVLSASHYNVS